MSRFQSLLVRLRGSLACSGATPQRFVMAVRTRKFGSGGGGHFLPKDEIEPRLLDCIKNFRDVDASKVTLDAEFSSDLGLDSLDTVELVLSFEDEFNVEIPEDLAMEIKTGSEALNIIAQTPFAK
eukprot:1393523-Amorphochlora_amoeboformis.AAC.2